MDPVALHPAIRSDGVNQFSELPELENISNFHTEMRGWVDSIRSGAPIVSPVSDALTVARIVDACYRSEMQRGAEFEVGSHDDGEHRRHGARADRHLLDQRR